MSHEPEPGNDRRAVRYARTREWLALVDLLFGASLLLVALLSGLSTCLRALPGVAKPSLHMVPRLRLRGKRCCLRHTRVGTRAAITTGDC